MSNYHVEPANKPQALTTEAIKAVRHEQVKGVSRRRAAARLAGRGHGPLAARGHRRHDRLPVAQPRGQVRRRRPDRDAGRRQGRRTRPARRRGLPGLLPVGEGLRRCSSIPTQQAFVPGEDATGDGTAVNVRALYQRCPHLGCKPNPCVKNFWLECPCHGSRYDRLGVEGGGRRSSVRRRAAWTASPSSVDGDGALDHRHRQDHPRPAARSRWASRGSSRRSRPPAASEPVASPPVRPPRRPMTDQPGRPPEERLPAPRPSSAPVPADRFSAPPAAHRNDLTPERAGRRSSASPRTRGGWASWP